MSAEQPGKELSVATADSRLSELLFDFNVPDFFVPCAPLLCHANSASENARNAVLAMLLVLEYRTWYRLVIGVYVEALREPEDVRIDEALHIDCGIRYVDGLMPDEIRVPSWAAKFEARRREKALERRKVREEAAA